MSIKVLIIVQKKFSWEGSGSNMSLLRVPPKPGWVVVMSTGICLVQRK